ncbi:helix-turn-helix transcriptional regulator [Actinomadura sp. WMMB 499]|uniref:helix-turn-helix domain-containing protein n=1 Tax=Actinomadura sp. WMMB 499 TaxID=1219491 RepID=UPI001C3F9A51|nr:helix-turn-helix transcriptional regulator [Actinomadura sp. WMMB 499]
MNNRLGEIVRDARVRRGWSQQRLGEELHCSASRISRLESGTQQLRDLETLQRLSVVLGIPAAALGIAANVANESRVLEDDPVRRRQLLTNLAVTAVAALPGMTSAPRTETNPGDLLVGRLRDVVLGSGPAPLDGTPQMLRTQLAASIRDFDACRFTRLAGDLPQLLATGHALAKENGEDPQISALLAEIYTLATRMLIKLDDQQLGWMFADRARILASSGEAPVIAGEAARNLAVLARKAGWYEQAASIALSAAESPGLNGDDPRADAERGLLVMSAAYTAARSGDRSEMRKLTDRAESIAQGIGGGVLLRDHGGGFGTAAVQLHRISAEHWAGDPSAAVAAAKKVHPRMLPTVERRTRYYTDVARAYGTWGRREECVRALLAAERIAPEETHARPAVRDLVSSLLVTGRTSPELQGLAIRCSIS